MEATIDNFGRLVIPKAIRDHLGLRPGTRVVLHEEATALVIEPAEERAALEVHEEVLVYGAAATGDLSVALAEHRADRLRQLGGTD